MYFKCRCVTCTRRENPCRGPFSRIYFAKTQSNKIKSACVALAKTINMQMAALWNPLLTATTVHNFQLHKLPTTISLAPTNPTDDAFHKQRSSPTSQTKYSPLAFISALPSLSSRSPSNPSTALWGMQNMFHPESNLFQPSPGSKGRSQEIWYPLTKVFLSNESSKILTFR